MQTFTPKIFNIQELKGISVKNIEEHLKLYAGYVNQANLVLEKIKELSENAEANMGLISGLQRRFGFEYNGMRNHEIYFDSLSGNANTLKELSENAEANMGILSGLQKRFGFEYNGIRNHEIYFDSLSGNANTLKENSEFKKAFVSEWGSFEKWLALFKAIATTRGIGWAMLYYDKKEKRLLNAWVDEQHLGQLQDCTPIVALDMWEHAYLFDYVPADKKKCIEAFFENLNWEVVEKNFTP